MNEREAIERELKKEQRTMPRQDLLKRLRKLELASKKEPRSKEQLVCKSASETKTLAC